jgi:hypothetical protein
MNRRCTCGLIALLAIAGCSGGHSIVGTWAVDPDLQHHLAGQTINFKADGTFDEDLSMTLPNVTQPLNLKTSGTWKQLSDNNFQKLTTDVDMTNLTPHGVDAATAAKMSQEEKPNLIKAFNKNNEFTPTWSGNDSFTVTSASNVTKTYHRKA